MVLHERDFTCMAVFTQPLMQPIKLHFRWMRAGGFCVVKCFMSLHVVQFAQVSDLFVLILATGVIKIDLAAATVLELS